MTEAALVRLAEDNPDALVEGLRKWRFKGYDAALAVEVMARMLPSQTVRDVLLELVHHPEAEVREATIFRLASFGYERAVRDVIRKYMDPEHEPSASVREAALDAIYLLDC